MLLHVIDPTQRDSILDLAKANGYDTEVHPDNPHSLTLTPTSTVKPDFSPDFVGTVLFDHNDSSQQNKFKPRCTTPKKLETNEARGLPTQYFLPPDIYNTYNFPPASNSITPNVCIVELGGGFSTSDLQYYWKTYLGYPTNGYPTVRTVGIDGATNNPSRGNTPGDADYEVSLDIQVIGGLFPNGKVNIYVYFAPNTDQGFYDAFQSAIYNTVTPFTAISCSWGGPEDSWGNSTLTAYDQLFAQAVHKGITIFAASGDNTSSDGESGLHVDFPASSPNAIGCGGTKLVCPNRVYASTTTHETVWYNSSSEGTGGGYSSFFSAPSFQISALTGSSLATSHRAVPDVAGNADPNSGWLIYIKGELYIVGGTSAVAPMWTALWTLTTEATGRTFAGPLLYNLRGTSSFNDNIPGNNGAYSFVPKYDLCTGLGTPNGKTIKSNAR